MGGACHDLLLMVIHDLDIDRSGRAVRPREANAPLVIDADAVLPLPVALECLQPVARQRGKVFQAHSGVQPVEPYFDLPGESGEFSNHFAVGKAFGSLVPVTDDHPDNLATITNYVKHKCYALASGPSRALWPAMLISLARMRVAPCRCGQKGVSSRHGSDRSERLTPTRPASLAASLIGAADNSHLVIKASSQIERKRA